MPSRTVEGPHDVLGVEPGCSLADIQRAYKRLALKHHPDKNLEHRSSAEEAFKRIAEAYEVLKEPARRRSQESETSSRTSTSPSASPPPSSASSTGSGRASRPAPPQPATPPPRHHEDASASDVGPSPPAAPFSFGSMSGLNFDSGKALHAMFESPCSTAASTPRVQHRESVGASMPTFSHRRVSSGSSTESGSAFSHRRVSSRTSPTSPAAPMSHQRMPSGSSYDPPVTGHRRMPSGASSQSGHRRMPSGLSQFSDDGPWPSRSPSPVFTSRFCASPSSSDSYGLGASPELHAGLLSSSPTAQLVF